MVLAYGLRGRVYQGREGMVAGCEVIGHTVHTGRKKRVDGKWSWATKPEGPFPSKL